MAIFVMGVATLDVKIVADNHTKAGLRCYGAGGLRLKSHGGQFACGSGQLKDAP